MVLSYSNAIIIIFITACYCPIVRAFTFSEVPERVDLWVSGDTLFRLWVDGAFTGIGPASAGGDFLSEEALHWYYKNPYTVTPSGKTLELFAQVQLTPQVLTEFSQGRGGFWLEGTAHFADGHTEVFGTDVSWQARLNRHYPAPCVYDSSAARDDWLPACETGDKRPLTPAPVKMLTFDTILPENPDMRRVAVKAGDRLSVEFPMIYSGYVGIAASAACQLNVRCLETPGVGRADQRVTFGGPGRFRSLRMYSVGACEIEVLSAADGAVIEPCLFFSHYPIEAEGSLSTSSPALDSIYELCRWTLNICRQTIHLDSPMHQELLACTGDYYIEALMTVFTYGDMSLARGDVLRTANWLVQNDGRMFHTTYSLIWVQMLELVYRMTGDAALIDACREALLRLLRRFETYLDEDGIVTNPPDYMFVDWTVIDGFSMHHPPRCLGQTVLNAFYYKALTTAAQLAELRGWPEGAAWREQAAALKEAFNRTFYDAARGLYIDGLPTPDAGNGYFHPANGTKVSVSRYPNILAPLYGLCEGEDALRLIRLMASDDTNLPPIQPYFMNFLLQAVEKYDLRGELGLALLMKWRQSVEACRKGLQEGWYKPEKGYAFDHSHAWGGCPAYFIPAFLTGLRVVKPGFEEIALRPCLMGLEHAEIAFPTPRGTVTVSLAEGKCAVTAPEGVRWRVEA